MQNDEQNKDLKQKSLEQVGSKGARAAADLATGGAYEKVRKIPIVKNVARGVENSIGKKAGSLGNLNNRRLDLIPNRKQNLKQDTDFSDESSDNLESNPSSDLQDSSTGLVDDSDNKNEKNAALDNDYSGRAAKGIIKGGIGGILLILSPILLIIGLIILLILVIIIIIAIPIVSISNFFSGVADKVVGYFTPEEEKLATEYKQELKNVVNKFRDDYDICIDVNLITAALTVNKSYDNALNEGNTSLTGKSVDGNDLNYKKMTKQVELLANMQVKTKLYGWDTSLDVKTDGKYCKSTGSESKVAVNKDNAKYFSNKLSDGIFGIGGIKARPSEDVYMISTNDLDNSTGSIINYANLIPKSDLEKNFEFILFQPVASGGKCTASLPGDENGIERELSIGDYKTRKDTVFYYNLIHTFIPDYYADSLSKNEETRADEIMKIADNIYKLYNDAGPSKVCGVEQSYICRSDEGSEFYGGSKNLTRQEFLDNIATLAINEMTRVGINASVTMAQAALESSDGSSGLSKKYSNYYGMTSGCISNKTYPPSQYKGQVLKSGESFNKCTGNNFWDGTVVAMCNKAGNDCQWYRVYDSFENSTKDHSRLLTSSRYETCNTFSDYVGQITCIKSAGYAADPDYVKKVSSVIKTYNLEQYDIGHFSGTIAQAQGISYTTNMCSSVGEVSGEWASWKQSNPRWKNVKIGGSRLGPVGCYITSMAILIAKSGAPTTLGSNFNPGTFATYLNDKGTFDKSGSCTTLEHVKEIVPSFRSFGSVSTSDPATIQKYLSQGYYLQIYIRKANGRPHFVAVNKVEGNTIHIYDPGNSCTTLNGCYPGSKIQNIRLYKIG